MTDRKIYLQEKITSPDNLCIYLREYYEETYGFMQKINQLALNDDKLVIVDLSNVKNITAAASLLLFATINTCQLTAENPNQVRCIFPSIKLNPEGHRYIVKTGLSRALHSGSISKLDDLVQSGVLFQSETNPSKHMRHTAERLIKDSEMSSDQFQLITSAIAEAMLNVYHHAYKNPKNDKEIAKVKQSIVQSIGERWWQCGWHDPKSNKWVFIICDIGIGIPGSYVGQDQALSTEAAAVAMEAAFTQGNSRFIGQGRGNGSEDMKRAIGTGCSQSETLLVYSGGIKYIFGSELKEPDIVPLEKFFNGTLVEWTLKLGGEQECV